MKLATLLLGFLYAAAAASEPVAAEAPAPTAPEAPSTEAPAAEAPPLDPELVSWYQDMRLACADRRAAIVARQQSQDRRDPGTYLAHSTWAAAAQAGAVSWAAATDPRVDDKALARTPEPADFRRLDPHPPASQAAIEPDLPAEVLGRLRAIELRQGQADVAWRAWQASPGAAERRALIDALEGLRGLCTGVE